MDSFCVIYVLSVPFSLVITCLERADLLTPLCVMCPCVLSLAHMVCYLTVSIPELFAFCLTFNKVSNL